MKYIIVGRTGTGKSTLARLLRAGGLRLAMSFTTRPQRSKEDTDYWFITKKEAESFPQEQKVLSTKLGEHEYFMSRREVEESDLFILDPNGVELITSLFPFEFGLIYLQSADMLTTCIKYGERNPNDRPFEERWALEKERFDTFEAKLSDSEFTCRFKAIHYITNDYKVSAFDSVVAAVLASVPGRLPKPNSVYRHYKGRYYYCVGVAMHNETGERLVVYRALYGEHELYVRPLSTWNDTVPSGDSDVPRFTRVS